MSVNENFRDVQQGKGTASWLGFGPKSVKFANMTDGSWHMLVDTEDDLSPAIYAGLKKLGAPAEETIIVFGYGADMDWEDVLDAAKKSGAKHVIVDDEEGNPNILVDTRK